MKRMVVLGALVLILALIGGPALATTGEGSVLPEQQDSEVLPASTSRTQRSTQASTGPALADTGLGTGEGALLAAGLLAAGGLALAAGRRRSGQST